MYGFQFGKDEEKLLLMGENMLLGFRLRALQMECVIGKSVNFIRKSI